MDALLLALLLGLALDQGDRSQHLARALSTAALPATALPAVCLIAIVGAIVPSLLGLLVAPYVQGRAGLLFFALTLILGAVGLLVPNRGQPTPAAQPAAATLYLRLLMHRLGDRSSFLLAGVAAMTGNGWATALGGMLGGLGALLPPLLMGAAYEKALPLRVIRPVLGAVLLVAGLASALSALGLV